MKEEIKFLLVAIFCIFGCLGLMGMILPLHKIILPLIGTCFISVTLMYGLFAMSVKDDE